MVARLRRAGFARSVLVLAGGTAGAQLINVASAPVLARLFRPDEIGQLGLFLAFVSFVAIALSLRYEQAVVVPADPASAARLVVLAVAIVPAVSLLASLALAGLIASNAMGYGSLDPIAVPIAFVGLAGFGTTTALRYWYLREARFRPVSEVQLLQAAVRSVGQVLAGIVGFGVGGLMTADAAARASGVVRLSRGAGRAIREAWAQPAPPTRELARRYWRFPILGMPSSLLNSAGQVLPVPLLAATYGLEVAGFMALVQRVLGVPLTVIGASVGDALLSRMVTQSRIDPANAPHFFRRTALVLAFVGAALAISLLAFGPALFALVFGEPWREAGVIAATVAPWLAAALVVTPLSRVVLVYQGQAQKLIYDALNLAAVTVGFLGGHAAGLTVLETVAMVTTLQVGAYGVFYIILDRIVRRGRLDGSVMPAASQ